MKAFCKVGAVRAHNRGNAPCHTSMKTLGKLDELNSAMLSNHLNITLSCPVLRRKENGRWKEIAETETYVDARELKGATKMVLVFRSQLNMTLNCVKKLHLFKRIRLFHCAYYSNALQKGINALHNY